MVGSAGEDRFCLEKIAMVREDVLNRAIWTQLGNLGLAGEDILSWGKWTQLGNLDSLGSIYSAGEDGLSWVIRGVLIVVR